VRPADRTNLGGIGGGWGGRRGGGVRRKRIYWRKIMNGKKRGDHENDDLYEVNGGQEKEERVR
jgi:hypothetical protein